MKIVISTHSCYRLPFNVVEKYFELNGLGKPYFYVRINTYLDKRINTYRLINTPSTGYYTSTKNLGEECHSNDIFGDSYFDEMSIERNDINLVKSIEELSPSNLKVVEIPDDVEWFVYESDNGCESIHEKHRIWG